MSICHRHDIKKGEGDHIVVVVVDVLGALFPPASLFLVELLLLSWRHLGRVAVGRELGIELRLRRCAILVLVHALVQGSWVRWHT